VPGGARVIEAKGRLIIPGMIHHFFTPLKMKHWNKYSVGLFFIGDSRHICSVLYLQTTSISDVAWNFIMFLYKCVLTEIKLDLKS